MVTITVYKPFVVLSADLTSFCGSTKKLHLNGDALSVTVILFTVSVYVVPEGDLIDTSYVIVGGIVPFDSDEETVPLNPKVFAAVYVAASKTDTLARFTVPVVVPIVIFGTDAFDFA